MKAPSGDRAGSADPADTENTARLICLRLLERRPRTRAELAAALQRRGVPDEAATQALTRLTEAGLIDDEAFATAWVESRHHSQGLSRRALNQELRKRGIADEVIGTATHQLSDEQEEETAWRLAQRRLRSLSGLDTQRQMRRLIGYLARKGYSASLAYRIAREAIAAAEEGNPGGASTGLE